MKNFKFIKYTDNNLNGTAIKEFADISFSEIPFDEAKQNREYDRDYKLIKASNTRCVIKFEAVIYNSPITVFAKRCKIRSLKKSIAHLFHKSKSRREFELGHKLLQLGIDTALPLIFAERKEGIFIKESFLLLKGVENSVDVRTVLENIKSPDEKKNFINSLARYLRKLHATGFYHDDCSTEHILVSGNIINPKFVLIDLDNCRLFSKIPLSFKIKNIFQLFRSVDRKYLSKEDCIAFIKEYLGDDYNEKLLNKYMRKIEKFSLSKDEKGIWE